MLISRIPKFWLSNTFISNLLADKTNDYKHYQIVLHLQRCYLAQSTNNLNERKSNIYSDMLHFKFMHPVNFVTFIHLKHDSITSSKNNYMGHTARKYSTRNSRTVMYLAFFVFLNTKKLKLMPTFVILK